MPAYSKQSDYSRYFGIRQKVFLVNMSEGRNSDIYESLTGVVVSSDMESLELMITTCDGQGVIDGNTGATTFKLTSESLGCGIQVLADLTATGGGNLCSFRLHGALELFQRRTVPRVELPGKLCRLDESHPLDVCRHEWERIRGNLLLHIPMPEISLQETSFSLSASGIGIMLPSARRPMQPSLMIIEFDGGLPVCVLAEPVWDQTVDEGLRCGFRFIYISKADQERISNCVRNELRKNGGTYVDYKRNWVLVDKMLADIRRPE